MPFNFEHYANPMVPPVTGKTILSYTKLMHISRGCRGVANGFGEGFRGYGARMRKNGPKRDKCDVRNDSRQDNACPSSQKFFTYANPVVDFRPQKDDPHRIRITAGGNLITYEGDASV